MSVAPPFAAETYGIILGTEQYEECVAFYGTTLGLPLWFEKPSLTCFRFGSGYLMVEHGGVAAPDRKTMDQNPAMLRFNVADVAAAAAELERRGVNVTIAHYDWGTVGTFADPDGNPCELKNADDPFFA
jgi:lactoylglutathione lyase